MPFLTDPAKAVIQIQRWIQSTMQSTGRTELILGLSGGIDSALACFLACEAIGPGRVHCIMMPYKTSSTQSLTDAHRVLMATGADSSEVAISTMVEAFERQIHGVDRVRRGNLCARVRMTILFDRSHASGLVLGTSNKSEMLLGYGTIHGDAAWSLNPLADLYKTDVRLLSKYVGVPQEIMDKAPTADLWEHQTDEAELGFSYEEMDQVLVKIVDEQKSRADVLAEGVNPELLHRVVQLVRGFSYKRRLPSMCWLSDPYSTAHIEDPNW